MNIWEIHNIQVNDWDKLLKIKFLENTKEEGIFCDVGACNGFFTSLFKTISKNGYVYSFEPNPYNYNNIQHLSDSTCIVENLAVSSSSKIVEIYGNSTRPSNFTSNILGHDTSFNKMDVIGQVKSTSLDEYFKDKRVDYIKIDVEGAEIDVIRGGIETLKKSTYVIIECHIQEHWSEIYDLLKSNNLDFKNLTNDEPIFMRECKEEPGLMSNGMPYQIYLSNVQ
jgi:FkbM family methyltransferase